MQGRAGFTKEYWDKNYADLESMDGVGNAFEHAQYIKYLFGIEYIDISSVIDLGFGMGHLFEEILKTFIPYRAFGIEPSLFPFEQVSQRDIRPVESTKLTLENTDLVSWSQNSGKKYDRRYDLGICTSVFQYLSEEEIDQILPAMALRVKFLYFSVPTNKELDRQIQDLDFCDEYAIRRSRNWYQKKLRKYFTFVSMRVLESKSHFVEEDSHFTDLLFRY
ncbi:MAG: class I SAM-dependent methyltransferase [Bacteriovoracaceae bacterium]|nr:class I SAM-dependent methyltransferase [Bacteriovoracaceae bacterium]